MSSAGGMAIPDAEPAPREREKEPKKEPKEKEPNFGTSYMPVLEKFSGVCYFIQVSMWKPDRPYAL